METRNAIELAHSFLHQKLRVYEFSVSETQRDDIEYAIAEYVNSMSESLLNAISCGNAAYLREHSCFEEDMRSALQRMEAMLEKI